MENTKEKLKTSFKNRIKNLINYFLKGLLIVLPFAVTYAVLKSIVLTMDNYIDVGIPAVGFFIVICSITFLGFIGSSLITKPLINLLDDVLSKIPFVKIIYTSVKDFMEAFVGDKKKFTSPVLVEMTNGIYKPGFITQQDLSHLGLPGLCAVYFPHSYAFSGNLFFVDKNKIKPFNGNSTEVMKFIVSGGVTDIE
ncbi:MAG: DUF502 domain-containing protein [Bacteroidia bacterium]|nr:DUF502 domain-containing protein [Bacteroidia bacterium]MCC7532969.1 DUF502 domain-containing protein [Bacteroidia bacterium]MCZ2141126.1 DUF502 domain-containing protein [Bacteroidia bacterium]